MVENLKIFASFSNFGSLTSRVHMSSSGEPVRRTFQEMISDAIIAADLAAFKRCRVGKFDIDRPLLPYRDLRPIPKVNPTEHYINIRGPTIVMLCILCENDEILEYVLENKSPDLSVMVNEVNAIHIAAMIRHPGPLQILLRYQWVQEHIDLPLQQRGIHSRDGDFVTALHCAVTNQRLENVFLLLSEFPLYKTVPVPAAKTVSGQKPVSPLEFDAEAAQVEIVKYPSANVDQPSAKGSTPLHVAVFIHNFPICRVLLAANADPTIGDEMHEGVNRVSARTLARQLAEKARVRQAEREADLARDPQKARKIVNQSLEDTLRIEELLSGNPPKDSLEDLKAELAPSLIARLGAEEEQKPDEEQNDHARSGEPEEAEPANNSAEAGEKPKTVKRPSQNLSLVLGKLDPSRQPTGNPIAAGDEGDDQVANRSTTLKLVLEKIVGLD
jgi:ankyrin repeat protein